MSNCLFNECQEAAKVRGYCTPHYQKLYQSGELEVIQPKRAPGLCEFSGGCDRPRRTKGLCKTHYQQYRRTGDVKGIRHYGTAA